MKQKASQLSNFLDKHLLILVCLLILVVLRIPNFFEPNWYGDEAIYLTVGQALRHGRKLYTSIVDHKTPLIYYLAAVPNQLSFRLLTTTWMITTSIMFYQISKSLFKNKTALWISNLLFVLLTSLPWLEGNIPNGELFVMGFVLSGMVVLIPTQFWQFLQEKKAPEKKRLLFSAGFLFGLAVLTKVPALLDFAAVLFISWLQLLHFAAKNTLKTKWKEILLRVASLFLGFMTPIVISIVYFAVQGRAQDYLQFGLLYNLHYTSNWGLDFNFFLSEFLFSLTGKTLLLGLSLLSISFFGENLDRRFKFILSWLILAFFAALLSNRPYPHYFQQLVPAFSLLIAYLAVKIAQADNNNTIALVVISAVTLAVIVKSALLLNFQPYPAWKYYQNFINFAVGKTSRRDYCQNYNYLMLDTYQAAAAIKKENAKEIFIWGTNPMLYDLSDADPAGKFTVSFHIKDIDAYDSTMASIRKTEPKIIVVMKNESGEFAELYQYIRENYQSYLDLDNMKLFIRDEAQNQR